ncbi:MAG TPA: hypothetical protein VI548_02065 [Chitinophagaceae bacterium]|nr:hypothetical protein [Chitinophagaceae bacterium]
MKKIFLILFCFISINLNAQLKDTVFIKRTISDSPYPFYHAIFIDSSPDSEHRKKLIDFKFNSFDSASYYEIINLLLPLNKIQNIKAGFPVKWITLNQYKGEYYLYRPSEAGYHFKFELTDSATIDYTMEGPIPGKIKRIKFDDDINCTIEREHPWESREVSIKIIDKQKGIAVFTFTGQKSDRWYHLMVDSKKANLFPVIVNYCITDKQGELDFDSIDFNKLLK